MLNSVYSNIIKVQNPLGTEISDIRPPIEEIVPGRSFSTHKAEKFHLRSPLEGGCVGRVCWPSLPHLVFYNFFNVSQD